MLKRLMMLSLLLTAGTAFGQSAASKYIELYKEEAIRKMNEYGIPASIILGVAMHESGSGTSRISKYLNNHFGVKGQNDKRIRSSYKGYDSVSQSYDDFISILKKHVQFRNLFEIYGPADYQAWAKGIQKGGYAHSRSWSAQVLAIINKYELYRYDQPAAPSQPGVLLSAYEPPAPLQPVPVKESPAKEPAPNIYKVKRGDTLLAIAKKFGTTVKTIRIKNRLKSANLSIGQRLTL
ncbi:glucosaminidase domain and LysM peptidoglycan-binding domain-containing protein [Hufsiella ginkgonis]|uniref:Peptidoglycan hydrolase n=1 Tax=Hufsiella ginkgonis TaxID=2695274 RepID=A0A7K1XW80_9SPHI|nr:glucosaminidase domain-containing protein [Hufsiella ginkgonis]MXV14776.1 LysM peptidoglycan-binding domain-containing protein [Hufsiella ginkgonis]